MKWKTRPPTQVVQRMDKATVRKNRWIVIYLAESVIHPFNKRAPNYKVDVKNIDKTQTK